MHRRPNILYLHSHDTGRDVQPYGHAVPTPALQQLAEQGILFRQAFCAGPTCSPSRAALLTGQYPHTNGMLGLAHRGFGLTDYRRHLVHTLHAAGYHSALIGVQHVAADPATIGYRQVIPGMSAPRAAAAATAFFDAAPEEPFFLSIGMSETHRAFRPPSRHEDARYSRPPDPIPDTPATRADMAAFKASARVLDQGIGNVLDALDGAGLADRTLVICTTDHGVAFPGMKCNLTDHGIGVMLIMRGPEMFSGGRVIDAPVSQVDVFPTLCEWLGISPPPGLQGVSLMPLIEGRVDNARDTVYAEINFHAAYEPQRAVRTARWKYIRRFDGRSRPVLPNCDDSPPKELWIKAGWDRRVPETEQLFDLVLDPQERCNRAGDRAAMDALSEMRARLDQWMRDTDDPLLRGAIVAPPGARVNHPDGMSPSEPLVDT